MSRGIEIMMEMRMHREMKGWSLERKAKNPGGGIDGVFRVSYKLFGYLR